MKSNVYRRIVALILAGLLLDISARADSTFDSNLRFSEEWLNWYSNEILIDDSLRTLSAQIASQCGKYDELPCYIHDWICENIYYDWDAFYESSYGSLNPADILVEKKSVCEGIANLVQVLFTAVGIPCIKVWGVAIELGSSWEESELSLGKVNHTWNEFYINGTWHSIDCTMDIRNRYENGIYIKLDSIDTFFDPDEESFSRTHLGLYKGDDLPSNIPSEWAKAELTEAVNIQAVPLRFFCDYHEPINEMDLCEMLNLEGNGDVSMTRATAALLISQKFNVDYGKDKIFSDISDCDDVTCEAIYTLYYAGIMRGTGTGTFSPNAYLTKQEAIIIAKRIKKGGVK